MPALGDGHSPFVELWTHLGCGLLATGSCFAGRFFFHIDGSFIFNPNLFVPDCICDLLIILNGLFTHTYFSGDNRLFHHADALFRYRHADLAFVADRS